MIHIIQVKGSNGSGKTSLVLDLGKLSENWTWLQTPDGLTYATVFDDINWVAIGKYDPNAKMGGCDLMPSVESMKQAILDVMKHYPDYWIVFEGMMISTIKSTFYEFLLDLEARGKAQALFVILKSTVDGCLERIAGRGTMKKDLKRGNIYTKCELVIRHAKEYDPAHVRWIDVETTNKESMMPCFLWEVGDDQLIDAIYNQPDL